MISGNAAIAMLLELLKENINKHYKKKEKRIVYKVQSKKLKKISKMIQKTIL